MMPSPTLILGAIFACLTAYFYGHHAGFVDRDQEMQAEIAAKNEQVRQTEHKLNEQLSATSTQLSEANNAINEKQSALDRAIRAGRVRLPSPSCVQAAGGTAAPSGNQQAGSESDTETLRLIAQIAADGDRAVNQLNACIDAYNQVREAANGQR
jgi:flagellar capping protein FliD